MTKIMTLLVACQRLSEWDLSQNSTLTQEIHDYVRPSTGGYYESSCHWPDVGDGATVLDQLYGIGVESAADCSVMVACYIVGKSPAESEAQFVQWMNEEAAAMGLTGTHFDNIIGYESEQNYSTPSDIAAILIRALESPLIAEILGTSVRAFTAYGYNSNGEFVHYSSCFYSTLFNANPKRSSREKAYEEKYGEFSLLNATLRGGKTGSLKEGSGWNYSLASFATTTSGKTYVCITANVTGGSAVLKDAKTPYDGVTP
jgi:D-alanyl-D-alanine carboxypeptidase (penicillin-binding protein 5/6)